MCYNDSLSKAESNRIFKEAILGFGFREVIQKQGGIYCDSCKAFHKRPTKMYNLESSQITLCKAAIVRYYNPIN